MLVLLRVVEDGLAGAGGQELAAGRELFLQVFSVVVAHEVVRAQGLGAQGAHWAEFLVLLLG